MKRMPATLAPRTVKVTNCVAERGVKIASDLDDSIRAMLMQGVMKSRRSYPDFRKETLHTGN